MAITTSERDALIMALREADDNFKAAVKVFEPIKTAYGLGAIETPEYMDGWRAYKAALDAWDILHMRCADELPEDDDMRLSIEREPSEADLAQQIELF